MSKQRIIFPPNDYVFDTHTEIQNCFIEKINEHGIDAAIAWLKKIKETELSHPRALTFVWEGSGGDVFELSENENFSMPYTLK